MKRVRVADQRDIAEMEVTEDGAALLQKLSDLLPSFAYTVLPEPAKEPKTPCPEGFHWIGQTLKHCEKCDLPIWEHAGYAVPREGFHFMSGVPDEQYWVLRPWQPGDRWYKEPQP